MVKTICLCLLTSSLVVTTSSDEIYDWLNKFMKSEFNIFLLSISIDQAEVKLQEGNYRGDRTFKQAFYAGLYSFLNDDSDLESPLTIAGDLCEPNMKDALSCAREKLLEHLDLSISNLSMITEAQLADKNGGHVPTYSEGIEDNWIFLLRIPTLSDHSFFAIAPRDLNKQAYNYGFN